ncbi:hypothetical protein Syun_022114 [Stephania yunnanensis]|uniref:Uncharacterized protein n=1 Tax=Stephania yunnanensis TaxID=152371 RepID=A0AAP0IH86_9MAGN
MPPKRNQQRIEEVYDRNNLNRQIGPLIDQRMVAVVEQLTAKIDQLLDRHMDRILPFERTDYWFCEETEGFPSRIERVRALGFGGLAQDLQSYQRHWRGGHGSEQGHQHDVTVQTPVHEFDDSGSKATPRKRLVKKSGDRERTPDFGIEDEEPAFMRDEFASEPPSSQKRKMSSKGGSLSAIYPGRDREMKELWDTVAGADSEDDQEGVRTMDDDNFIDDTGVDPADRYGSDNEGFIGDAPQLEKGHGTRESLDILLGKALLQSAGRGSLVRGAKEKWLAVRLTLR